MGVIRGGLFVLASVLFLIAVLILGVLMTVSNSLEKQNVKENIGKIVAEQLSQKIDVNGAINQARPYLEMYCQNNSYFYLDASQAGLDMGVSYPLSINISCDKALNGSDVIIGEVVDEGIEQLYNKDYQCTFLNCLESESDAFYFFSLDFKNYLDAKYYFVFIAVIVLFVLMFLFSRSKSNAFLVAGVMTFLVSLLFMKMTSLFGFVEGYAKILLDIFFSESYLTFLRLFIVGIFVLGIGIILKFTSLGAKFARWLDNVKTSDKEDKRDEEIRELKKEVSDMKKKKSKKKK